MKAQNPVFIRAKVRRNRDEELNESFEKNSGKIILLGTGEDKSFKIILAVFFPQ